MLIVWSKETLMESYFTSSKTVLYFDRFLSFSTVYSDSHRIDNKVAKYFPKRYDAVTIFETIDWMDTFSAISFSGIL